MIDLPEKLAYPALKLPGRAAFVAGVLELFLGKLV